MTTGDYIGYAAFTAILLGFVFVSLAGYIADDRNARHAIWAVPLAVCLFFLVALWAPVIV